MKINEELKRVSHETSDGAVKTKMAILKKRIDKEIDNQNQNQIFESYFEEVHADFFERLKDKFPHLSPKDLRLCAYIRMNMSTKEIATLLNISDRGVEISRYRLRKKLELSREVNLSTFLLNL
jgi:DNA-binding CsgD family transcriptional regulator